MMTSGSVRTEDIRAPPLVRNVSEGRRTSTSVKEDVEEERTSCVSPPRMDRHFNNDSYFAIWT